MGEIVRQPLTFTNGETALAGALDDGDRSTGLLIVSGGNEIMSGSHGSMASLAQRIASAGYPVMRYDRSGIGDSEGENLGFRGAANEIACALNAFRAARPELGRVVGFGNCDAATSLALFHAPLALDALVLANPWAIETAGELPPPAAIAARYRDKLRDPAEWLRLVRGGVNLRKLFKGLRAVSSKPTQAGLADDLRDALAASRLPLHLVLAHRDATALAFAAHWRSEGWRTIRERAIVTEVATSSHSFAHVGDRDRLFAAILAALSGQAATA